MKSVKPFAIIGVLLALAACGPSKTTLTYDVTVKSLDATRAGEIIKASERVINRRMAGAEVEGAVVTVVPTGSGAGRMTLDLPNAEAVEKAERILADGFTFDMRIEEPKTDANGSPIESDWMDTGLSGTVLTWITPVNFTGDKGEVGVELTFNAAGRELLTKVFNDNKGKHIGIFVRDLLVSKMQIATTKPADHIVISGIPSLKVAEIFSDDVNVGLYAIFTPVR